MPPPSLSSRISGSLQGLAVVDALGAPVEFKPRGTFPLVSSMLPNANFSLPAGCFTDDTSQALCLAYSLIESSGRVNVVSQVRGYLRWKNGASKDGYMSSVPKRGCFDIGVGTSEVLCSWKSYLGGAGRTKSSKEQGEGGLKMIQSSFGKERYCGNGSLMRVASVALAFYDQDVEILREAARVSSRTTHPHIRCQEACALFVTIIVKALHGGDKAALVEVLAQTEFRDEPLRERLSGHRSLSDWQSRQEEDIKSTGYVLDTLEAALWAFFTTETFEEGAMRAVNLGWDADTVGAVYGGLAGAFYGVDAIPEHWIKEMRQMEVVRKAVEGLDGLEGKAVI